MQLNIKKQSGGSFTIEANDSDTIRAIKQKIQEKEGIAVQDQNIIFSGRKLEDDRMVNEYNFSGSSMVHLIVSK
jgi:hypothetical protein